MNAPAQSLAQRYGDMIEHDGERARRELAQLVQLQPQSVEARWLLSLAFLRCLDFAAALEHAREALELQPNHSDALHGVAQCLLSMDDYEGAAAAYERAFEATHTTRSAARLAILLHRLGRLEAAERWNATVIRGGRPDGLEEICAQRNMVRVLRDLGRPFAADRFAHALIQRFRREPFSVSSAVVDMDQSVAFHEWFQLAEKSRLAQLLRKGLAVEPGGRVPETFELPQEREALARFAAASPPGALYIVKPVRGTGGQGISVVNDIAPVLERGDVVVQRYVADPYLMDGRKGHLRIYALVTSTRPLRAYVYSEGIVRFAPEPYDPRPERLADIAMHVTNTALHVGHPGLQISEDASRDDAGSIWSLSAMFRRMQAEGRDTDKVFGEIRDLVAWFVRLLAREGLFERQAARAPGRAFGPKLFGLDVLLDADGHPWLIEMQAKPAAKGAALVNRINGEMFSNIFRMTVDCLLDDAMSAGAVEAIRRDADALAARERDIELAQLGRFVPLDLGQAG